MAINLQNKIHNISGKLNSKPVSVISKAIGIGAIAALIHDAHVNGKEKAYAVDSNESADKFINQYKNYMTSEKESATIAKLKSCYFDLQQNVPLKHLGLKTKGYILGFGKTIKNNLPILLLSIVSLKSKKLGKLSSAILSVIGIKTALYDVAGVGSKKERL